MDNLLKIIYENANEFNFDLTIKGEKDSNGFFRSRLILKGVNKSTNNPEVILNSIFNINEPANEAFMIAKVLHWMWPTTWKF